MLSADKHSSLFPQDITAYSSGARFNAATVTLSKNAFCGQTL
jgi:hypothetical protein